jgi:hypothetical protein
VRESRYFIDRDIIRGWICCVLWRFARRALVRLGSHTSILKIVDFHSTDFNYGKRGDLVEKLKGGRPRGPAEKTPPLRRAADRVDEFENNHRLMAILADIFDSCGENESTLARKYTEAVGIAGRIAKASDVNEHFRSNRPRRETIERYLGLAKLSLGDLGVTLDFVLETFSADPDDRPIEVEVPPALIDLEIKAAYIDSKSNARLDEMQRFNSKQINRLVEELLSDGDFNHTLQAELECTRWDRWGKRGNSVSNPDRMTFYERECARILLAGRLRWLAKLAPRTDRDPRWGSVDDRGFAPFVAWINRDRGERGEPVFAQKDNIDLFALIQKHVGVASVSEMEDARVDYVFARLEYVLPDPKDEAARAAVRALLPLMDFTLVETLN